MLDVYTSGVDEIAQTMPVLNTRARGSVSVANPNGPIGMGAMNGSVTPLDNEPVAASVPYYRGPRDGAIISMTASITTSSATP